jgi:hypothetical protein
MYTSFLIFASLLFSIRIDVFYSPISMDEITIYQKIIETIPDQYQINPILPPSPSQCYFPEATIQVSEPVVTWSTLPETVLPQERSSYKSRSIRFSRVGMDSGHHEAVFFSWMGSVLYCVRFENTEGQWEKTGLVFIADR